KLESIPCEEWLERWSGRRVVDRIWLPLLKSKLGDNYRIASAAFIWTTIARLYAARRSGLKREMFGYVDGGYDLILSKLQERLDSLGVETRYGASVTQIRDEGGSVSVDMRGAEPASFDKVVLTIPTSSIAELCPGLSEAEKTRLRSVEYQGIVCASLLTKQPLGPYY